MANNLLDELAIYHGADKWGKHNYTPVYYELFELVREKVKKVVEIGAGEGASLRMWSEFFINAQIYGADNQDNRIFETDRIKVIKCDQAVSADLMKLIAETGTDIDLFVDDGSHVPQHQLETCLVVMPMLRKGATYVIEDVADPSIYDTLNQFYNCTMLKLSRRYDDRLIIVRHKNG